VWAAWRAHTRRFPELLFAFLKGGVGWPSQLFGDLMGLQDHQQGGLGRALQSATPLYS
jgi:hypothetical protein